ncbi:MAG: TonB-dependent receptor family protein [Myxococcota bacterium]
MDGAAETEVEDAEVMTIVGSRVPGQEKGPYVVTDLDASDIQNGRPTLSLGESLAQVPGVFAFSRSNFTQDTRIAIRGFGARSAFGVRGLRVFLDGVPLTSPGGQTQLDTIELAALGRIQVLRGPVGSLYGNAAGGVILLESRDPRAETQARWTNVVGSFGLWKTLAHGSFADESFQASGTASRTRIGGFRDQSSAEQFNLQTNASLELSEAATLSTVLSFVSAPVAEDPGGLTEADFRTDPTQAAATNLRFQTGERLHQLQVGGRLETEWAKGHAFDLSVHLGTRSFDGNIPFTVISFDRLFGGVFGLYRWTARWKGLESSFATGVEFQSQRDDRTNEDNEDGFPTGVFSLDQREVEQSLGVFGQEKLSIERWEVLGSVRYDRVSFRVEPQRDLGLVEDRRSLDQVTGQGGLLFRPGGHVSVFANVSQSFQTPTLTELVNSAEGTLSQTLQPERALQVETGARGRWSWLFAEASLFWIRLTDELIPEEDELNRTVFTNAGRSRRLGAEAYLRMAPIPGLELLSGYSYLRSEFRDGPSSGNRVPGLPAHRFFGRVRGRFRQLHAAFEVEWVDDVPATDENDVLADDYALAEVRLGAEASILSKLSLDLTVGLRNLFDARYADNVRINAFGERFFEPAPPFHVVGTVTLQVRP